ncbi:hypothetical protein Taro_042024 [Colocasia esculenta]|uniref:Uncharacterized protein n=1 Tax=Colocasia esculenta TaxID=4460 RepID=A0A843WVB6_COLES|nr:hypothetical protein [Colocasia esculenta]
MGLKRPMPLSAHFGALDRLQPATYKPRSPLPALSLRPLGFPSTRRRDPRPSAVARRWAQVRLCEGDPTRPNEGGARSPDRLADPTPLPRALLLPFSLRGRSRAAASPAPPHHLSSPLRCGSPCEGEIGLAAVAGAPLHFPSPSHPNPGSTHLNIALLLCPHRRYSPLRLPPSSLSRPTICQKPTAVAAAFSLCDRETRHDCLLLPLARAPLPRHRSSFSPSALATAPLFGPLVLSLSQQQVSVARRSDPGRLQSDLSRSGPVLQWTISRTLLVLWHIQHLLEAFINGTNWSKIMMHEDNLINMAYWNVIVVTWSDTGKASRRIVKFEKAKQFYEKVKSTVGASLAAKKTISKSKRNRSRQKKLKAYDLSSFTDVIPDVNVPTPQPDATNLKLNCKSRKKLV